MKDEDIKKIGDEMTRLLEPVYESLDNLEGEVKGIKKVQKEHTDKIDALMAEVHDIHQEIGADRDKTNSEIEKIKEHIGLPSNFSTE